MVERILQKAGFLVVDSSKAALDNRSMSEMEQTEDEDIALMNRALRAFQRSTGVNENTLHLRLGKRAKRFEEVILPELLETDILIPDVYRGGGMDRRFRLGIRMSELERALRGSQGSFSKFLSIIKRAAEGNSVND
jgi:hypothetical protein